MWVSTQKISSYPTLSPATDTPRYAMPTQQTQLSPIPFRRTHVAAHERMGRIDARPAAPVYVQYVHLQLKEKSRGVHRIDGVTYNMPARIRASILSLYYSLPCLHLHHVYVAESQQDMWRLSLVTPCFILTGYCVGGIVVLLPAQTV